MLLHMTIQNEKKCNDTSVLRTNMGMFYETGCRGSLYAAPCCPLPPPPHTTPAASHTQTMALPMGWALLGWRELDRFLVVLLEDRLKLRHVWWTRRKLGQLFKELLVAARGHDSQHSAGL